MSCAKCPTASAVIQQAHAGLSCCSKNLVCFLKMLRILKCRQAAEGNLLAFIVSFLCVWNNLQFGNAFFCKKDMCFQW